MIDLTTEQKKSAVAIIQEYNRIYEEIKSIENQLTILNSRKQLLISNLDKNREKENIWVKSIGKPLDATLLMEELKNEI